MKLKVYSSDGSKGADKEFANFPVLEEGKGVEALRQMIVAINVNNRQGNASTKTRGEVSGTGKKPWRQKGTGMARAGSKRSPIFRGGGIVFGPRPRDYHKKVNQKVKRLAMQRALVDVASSNAINVIESFNFDAPKTKEFVSILKNIGIDSSVLVIDNGFDENVAYSARNIPEVALAQAEGLNPLELLDCKQVLITESALQLVLERVSEKEVSNAVA